MKITLVGMGSGAPGGLTVRGLAALQGAGLIIGARRLLQNLPDGCTDNRTALYKTDEICALLQEAGCEQAAVVFSGDTGFYSGAGALCRALDAAGTPYTVEPGVSSVQLLAAAALPLIWLYRGRQGPHSPVLQGIWYAFYPAHLLLLWWLARSIGI